jgi:mRNA-degrading endonuclease RelE of RelBE toxin-antitoxin system
MVFIETSIFTKDIKKYLSDEEYRRLQESLMLQPTVGEIIQGSGGLRKVRWSVSNEGKSSGLRIIYYWYCPDTLYMLFHYCPNVSRITSTGYMNHHAHFRNLHSKRSVKWAYF